MTTGQAWFLVVEGNDNAEWSRLHRDFGESLGWAFRCAMTQEEG